MGLRHVVITSVTRDDLADGGAGHFSATIAAVRARLPQAAIEVLVPDLGGDAAALETVLAARPDVLNHNIEMVERLFSALRPQARYGRSLELLERARQYQLAHRSARPAYTKSGLMLGLGEAEAEVRQVLNDLRGVGCDILTIGQYLAPSARHEPVAEFVTPERFEQWRREALAMGFAAVAAGPLVRSSYRAGEMMPGGAEAQGNP
jgi:lipoic acid synthetase